MRVEIVELGRREALSVQSKDQTIKSIKFITSTKGEYPQQGEQVQQQKNWQQCCGTKNKSVNIKMKSATAR